MNATLEPAVAEMNPALQEIIRSACQRIPPLWTLKNFVAVNPFVGLSHRPFIEAAQLIRKVGHGDMFLPAEYYLAQITSGRIQESDFAAAMELAWRTLPEGQTGKINFSNLAELTAALASAKPVEATGRVLTFADFLDAETQSSWAAFVVEEISKWCSAYCDQGQSSWRMPWRDRELFAAWKAAAQLDANPELNGLKDFRRFVKELPDDPQEFIGRALDKLGVPEASQADFLHRQLMSISGWSSYMQFIVREKSMAGQAEDALAQLLAIRLAYDLALLKQFDDEASIGPAWKNQTKTPLNEGNDTPSDLQARYVALQALEQGYQRGLITMLKSNVARTKPTAGPKLLQAIFCIDVRSEVFRRSLETQSEEIETIGFAGFFGMTIEYLRFGQSKGGACCPVLLTPKITVRESLRQGTTDIEVKLLRSLKFRQAVAGAWNSFKTSAISCFSFVETVGLLSGVRLVKDSLALSGPESTFAASSGPHAFGPQIEREVYCPDQHGQNLETGITLADQIVMATGALKNMGLTSNFARIVLVCGHGSATTNNPYGSALDCGACGGHSGDANARVAVAILNKPAVRDGLKQQGIEIPAETFFVAGLHNTTTDEVLLYDVAPASASQLAELEKIKLWLVGASKKSRRERAASLGLAGLPEAVLDATIFKRSRDWSQVRPEWGLAGNAAFIAAPRERTKGLNLGGRTFLHNYDASKDADRSVLTLIMVAPMVVASWINLQYYGSTVNNRLFGSGNKIIHNVLGTFGVWQGNGGDLQFGLPLQSVHDGTKWMHEPLRLNVFIEAPREAIQSVIANQSGVRELIENGWVNLFAVEAAGKAFYRHVGGVFKEESA
jgi:uncharacterized protein YbcC (UPF0753/DUF2309 family)